MRDWTADVEGRSNSSETFEHLADEIARLIRRDGHRLLAGDTSAVARLILAELAHVHGLAPRRKHEGGPL